jgi:hypothetical protein
LYEILTDHSTYLEYLLVAMGCAELGNKMALYVTDQNVLVIKIVYSSDGSCFAVERQYLQEFSVLHH